MVLPLCVHLASHMHDVYKDGIDLSYDDLGRVDIDLISHEKAIGGRGDGYRKREFLIISRWD